MNIFRLIGEIIVIYILYKLIFDFIIPLWRASKEMKGKMNDIQANMRRQQEAEQLRQRREADAERQRAAAREEDYIDYEEIKS